MELYLERGYEQTTVADIAERAGLTARTFFRYFSDKREILFAGSASLQKDLVAALEGAPESATAMEAVSAALDAVAAIIGQDREYSGRRQSVIASNLELRERELIKMASWATALADGLRRRGVADPHASLAAEAGIAVFRVAFERWVIAAQDRDLALVIHQSLDELKALTTGG